MTFKAIGLKVFVIPGLWTAAIRGIFIERGYIPAHKLDEANLVVWTGGADVQPKYYNEREIPDAHCYFSPERDDMEFSIYNNLPKTGGPLKVGICRGAQLLCVASGGSLWQDIDGHGRIHDVKDMQTGELIAVSSMHHQEMRPPKGSYVWALAQEANKKLRREGDAKHTQHPNRANYQDVEAVWIPQTSSFCFQAHPEVGPKTCTDYFFKLIDRALLNKASIEEIKRKQGEMKVA